jgi:hypothetical protein
LLGAQAGVLDPKWPTLDFFGGRLLAEAKWWRSTKVCLDRLLARQPEPKVSVGGRDSAAKKWMAGQQQTR